jgi:hypothetical protein
MRFLLHFKRIDHPIHIEPLRVRFAAGSQGVTRLQVAVNDRFPPGWDSPVPVNDSLTTRSWRQLGCIASGRLVVDHFLDEFATFYHLLVARSMKSLLQLFGSYRFVLSRQ